MFEVAKKKPVLNVNLNDVFDNVIIDDKLRIFHVCMYWYGGR